MGTPDIRRGDSNGRRLCPGCGALLAADNTARLCGRCHSEAHDQLAAPPANLKPEFFQTDDLLAAFESQEIGNVFKAYRFHPRFVQLFGKPLPQEVFCRWLGLNQGQVSKLENGTRVERNLDTLRTFASVLHLPRELLWFDYQGDYRGGAKSRSEKAQPTAVLITPRKWIESSYDEALNGHRATADLGFVRLAARESVNYGLRHQVAEVHFTTIEQIEEEVGRLSEDFITGDPLETFNRSRQLRNDIFTLLEGKWLPRQEQLLYGYGARTLGYLAGASADFYGLYDAAADHIRVARRFSDASEFAELRAWVFSLQSANEFWMDSLVKAATSAERAMAIAVTRSGVMRATSMRARALARLGDRDGLHLAISQSEASSIDAHMQEERGMILFSEPNHLRCVGTAYLWAGEHSRAREQLANALEQYLASDPDNFAVIATIRADIATAYLHQSDIDGAANAVAPLLEMRSDRRLEGALRRMRALKDRLSTADFTRSESAIELSGRISNFLLNTAPKPSLSEE